MSSSRKSTPPVASEISPGRGPAPPPTSAGAEAPWCGARNGGRRIAPDPGRSTPAAECTRVTSSAVSSSSAGSSPGSRRASIVLPTPGGPIMSMLCPPTAASSSARRASGWPRTSARSGPPAATPPLAGTARGSSSSPRSHATTSRQVTRAVHGHARDERRLGGARARTDERVEADAPRGLGRDQRTVHRAQPAVERQLSEHEDPACALARQLIAGGQDRHRHRQVVARPELRDVARREVEDDASLRPPELARDHARAHALARLADRAVGQADDDRRAVPAAAHARLDLHQLTLDPDRRLAVGDRDHGW